METRHISRLDRDVSAIGLGTWQLGADWGNVAAADLPPLRAEQLAGVSDVYDRLIRQHVHDRW